MRAQTTNQHTASQGPPAMSHASQRSHPSHASSQRSLAASASSYIIVEPPSRAETYPRSIDHSYILVSEPSRAEQYASNAVDVACALAPSGSHVSSLSSARSSRASSISSSRAALLRGLGGRDTRQGRTSAFSKVRKRQQSAALQRAAPGGSIASGRSKAGQSTVQSKAASHHTQPASATSHHTQPASATSHHTQPVSATSHHTQPVSATSHHTQPASATSHHTQPVSATSHHTSSSSSSHRSVKPCKHTAGRPSRSTVHRRPVRVVPSSYSNPPWGTLGTNATLPRQGRARPTTAPPRRTGVTPYWTELDHGENAPSTLGHRPGRLLRNNVKEQRPAPFAQGQGDVDAPACTGGKRMVQVGSTETPFATDANDHTASPLRRGKKAAGPAPKQRAPFALDLTGSARSKASAHAESVASFTKKRMLRPVSARDAVRTPWAVHTDENQSITSHASSMVSPLSSARSSAASSRKEPLQEVAAQDVVAQAAADNAAALIHHVDSRVAHTEPTSKMDFVRANVRMAKRGLRQGRDVSAFKKKHPGFVQRTQAAGERRPKPRVGPTNRRQANAFATQRVDPDQAFGARNPAKEDIAAVLKQADGEQASSVKKTKQKRTKKMVPRSTRASRGQRKGADLSRARQEAAKGKATRADQSQFAHIKSKVGMELAK